MSGDVSGAIVISPHRFSDMSRESTAAAGAGLRLIETQSQAELLTVLPYARVILMTPFARLDAEAIATASRCIAIVRYGVGYDNIDIDAATSSGIPVANVPGASVDEISLHAVTMALSLLRRLPQADASLRSGSWGGTVMDDVPRISHVTVGIVGIGRTGSATAARFAALGAKVIAYDPAVSVSPYDLVSLDDLLERSLIVSLHATLTQATQGLLSAERLAQMRRGVILVNVSRGGLVDEVALARALEEGHIGAAGIDVFSEEPLPADHPLRGAPRTILTPHVAWRSVEAVSDYQEIAVAQVRAALQGEPMQHTVNQEVYTMRKMR